MVDKAKRDAMSLRHLSNYREAELLKIVKSCTDMKQEGFILTHNYIVNYNFLIFQDFK